MTYSFTIPGQLPGLNEIIAANRSTYHAGAKQKRDAQFMIKLAARKLPKLTEPVKLEYVWYEPARRRDWDNVMAGQKFVQDALVEARKLSNDGWANICGISHEFRVDKDNPRVEVTITDSAFAD